jgi:hypothetical protein
MLCLVGRKVEEKKKEFASQAESFILLSLFTRDLFSFLLLEAFLGNQTEPISSKHKCEKQKAQ